MRALRRDHTSSDTFPHDVLELQGYLAGESRIPGVQAVPGAGTHVPLYILGSSMFGAKLAAAFGLPYAFASHFAPDALQDAVAAYRSEFRPSAQLDAPHVIAAVNVIAADTQDDADSQHLHVRRRRAVFFVGGGGSYSDDEADRLLDSPQGRQVGRMMRYSAVGTPDVVQAYLDEFATHADADELIVAHASPTTEQKLRSVDLLADVAGLVPA